MSTPGQPLGEDRDRARPGAAGAHGSEAGPSEPQRGPSGGAPSAAGGDSDAILTAPDAPTGASDAPAATPPLKRHLAAVLVFALLAVGAHLAQVWHPYKWLGGDGSFYLNVSRGLVENGSLVQDTNHPRSWYERDLGWNRNLDAGWSNVAVAPDGETWYPKHPILLPIASTPFFFAFGVWGSLIFNLLALLLIPVLAWRIAVQLGPPWAALAAVLVLATSPVLAEHGWSFSNDVFYSVLLMAAFDQALRRRAAPAGVLLGFAVFAKFTSVLMAPAIGIPFLLRRDWRGILKLGAGFAGPVLVLMATNWVLYGGPLTTGYHRILVMENGAQGLHSHVADFRWDRLLPSLGRVLFSRGGVVARFPLLIPAVLGVVALAWRRRWAPAAALVLAMAPPVLFHAPYDWFRISFVLPTLALAAPAAAALFGRPVPAPEGPRRVRVRWGRLAVAGLAVLVLVGGVRRLAAGPAERFTDRVREAAVVLGDVPCDYYNNQNARWECAHFDRGTDLYMTGLAVWPEPRFGGEPRPMVNLSPHPTGRVRAIEYPVDGEVLELTYGVADGGRAPVPFRVLAGDELLLDTRADRGLTTTRLELPEGTERVRFETSGRTASPLSFDGLVR